MAVALTLPAPEIKKQNWSAYIVVDKFLRVHYGYNTGAVLLVDKHPRVDIHPDLRTTRVTATKWFSDGHAESWWSLANPISTQALAQHISEGKLIPLPKSYLKKLERVGPLC